MKEVDAELAQGGGCYAQYVSGFSVNPRVPVYTWVQAVVKPVNKGYFTPMRDRKRLTCEGTEEAEVPVVNQVSAEVAEIVEEAAASCSSKSTILKGTEIGGIGGEFESCIDFDAPGYCYLAVFQGQYRALVARRLGPSPTLRALLGCNGEWFVADSELFTVRCVPTLRGGWHVVGEGHISVGSVLYAALKDLKVYDPGTFGYQHAQRASWGDGYVVKPVPRLDDELGIGIPGWVSRVLLPALPVPGTELIAKQIGAVDAFGPDLIVDVSVPSGVGMWGPVVTGHIPGTGVLSGKCRRNRFRIKSKPGYTWSGLLIGSMQPGVEAFSDKVVDRMGRVWTGPSPLMLYYQGNICIELEHVEGVAYTAFHVAGFETLTNIAELSVVEL